MTRHADDRFVGMHTVCISLRTTLLSALLALSSVAAGQAPPTPDLLLAYDRRLETLSSTGIESTSPDQRLVDDRPPLALAELALERDQPQLALQLLEGYEATLDPLDPALAYLFELRSLAYTKLDMPREARISDIGRLESLRARLGPTHDQFLLAVSRFENQWATAADIPAAELMAFTSWLRSTPSVDETIATAAYGGAPVVVPVWYGTNRVGRDSTDPAGRYGYELGPLEVGRLQVTIPPNHQRSVIELPSIWSLTTRADPFQHIVLDSVQPLSDAEFTDACCRHDILLFVHGYNVSFHDGALRSAQLAYDLDFPGDIHYFSWPSQASIFGYLSDANNVVPTRPALINYLERITRSQQRVHIVAHSMGNRYLLEALEIFLRDFPDRQLGHIMFAAPDVDRLEFDVRLQSLFGRTLSLTLYTSDNDKALRVSQSVNGRARAGDSAQQPLHIDGLDTIDASGTGTDALGHSYFGDAEQVLADILGLLRFDWSPGTRCSVAREADNWRIRQDGCSVDMLLEAAELVKQHGEMAADEARQQRDTVDVDQKPFWDGVLTTLSQLIREAG